MWLCSPETAAAAALTGRITDPRDLPMGCPTVDLPAFSSVNIAMLEAPPPPERAREVGLVKAPSIGTLPELDPLPDELKAAVVIKVGDDISTDEILPAGARALPYRSNIARLAEFAFTQLDEEYPERARQAGRHIIVGGRNYGQGSSREHAVIAPRHLGLRIVIAKSYARIHWQNLVNFGVLPLEFTHEADYDRIDQGDELAVDHLHGVLTGEDGQVRVRNLTKDETYLLRHRLSARQRDIVAAGGQIPLLRRTQPHRS